MGFHELSSEKQKNLIEVARLHYIMGETKVAIAERLSISRFQVARLLQEAVAEGIMTFTLNERPDPHYRLADNLARALDLKACRVVAAVPAESARDRVAAEGADYLVSMLRSGDYLGFSWGRTVARLSEHLEDLPPVTVVQTTGMLTNDIASPPIDIFARTATHTPSRAFPLLAPLLADTPAAADAIRRQRDVRAALGVSGSLSAIVVSAGSWVPRTTQLPSYMDQQMINILESRNVVGEVGSVFLDEQGSVIDADLADRFIRITPAELVEVPLKILVAHGEHKAPVALAGVRGGLVNCLVIDSELGERLLRLISLERAEPDSEILVAR